jgi:exodeoxyribonuclease-3
MFRLVSLNLNGIRSAADKGFLAWAEQAGADCIGVQEVKAQAEDVAGRFDSVAGMPGHFHFAQKKGYSGVGLYSRKAPSEVIAGFGSREFDAEGRWVETRYDTARRKFSVISCYFPSGSLRPRAPGGQVPLPGRMYPHLVRLKAEREFILVGDVNIAHREIDLKNWKSNQKNSGFLPEERAWLDEAVRQGRAGGRVPHPQRPGPTSTPGGASAARPRQERGLAAGLPPGHAGHRGEGPARTHLPGRALLGPRAGGD